MWAVKHKQPRTAVIIGVNKQGLLLSKMIEEQPLLGIKLLGFFEDRRASRLPQAPPCLLGRIGDAAAFVSQHGVNLVYITLRISPRPGLTKLLNALRDSVASVYFVPDLHALNDIQARVDVVHGIPMFAVYASPFFGVRSLAKRASDIVLSGLLLLCLLPVLIAVATGVKCTSRGPGHLQATPLRSRWPRDHRLQVSIHDRNRGWCQQLHPGYPQRQPGDAFRSLHSSNITG